MKNRKGRILSAACGFSVFLMSSGDGIAQESPQPAVDRQVICMTRIGPDGTALHVIAPSLSSEALAAKGFSPISCTVNFATPSQRDEWRDAICQIAGSWREDLQNHFETVRGERPAVLCGMAEIAIAQWVEGGAQ